ncbi:unnamed protein product, partial [Brenthis ino]
MTHDIFISNSSSTFGEKSSRSDGAYRLQRLFMLRKDKGHRKVDTTKVSIRTPANGLIYSYTAVRRYGKCDRSGECD